MTLCFFLVYWADVMQDQVASMKSLKCDWVTQKIIAQYGKKKVVLQQRSVRYLCLGLRFYNMQ